MRKYSSVLYYTVEYILLHTFTRDMWDGGVIS